MTLAIGLWAAQETGGFAVDPSASGSGYTAVRTLGPISMHKVDRKLHDAPHTLTRLRKTAKRVGPDGAQITFSIPFTGLAAAVAEGGSPGALDLIDFVLASMFGAGTNVAGVGCSSCSSTVFTETGGGNTFNPDDILGIYESGQNTDRVQWRVIDSEGTPGQYTVRTLSGTLTTAAYSVGYRYYQPPVVPAVSNGYSIACYVSLAGGRDYTLLGGRPTSAKLVMEAGMEAHLDVTLTFDQRVAGTKASIPAVTSFSPPAIVGQLGSFLWGTTAYETGKIEVDWALGTADRKAVSGANGRGDIRVRSADLKIMVAPPFGSSFEDDFDAATQRRAELVFGGGALAGGIINAAFMSIPAAQISSFDFTDDSNEPRMGIALEACDIGYTGSTLRPYWRLCRA